jgi:cholesterol transport system auxiliary component
MHQSILIFFLILLLSGCLSPVAQEKKNNYLLNTLPQSISIKHHASPDTVMIMPTESRPIYNTTLMVYRIRPYQVNYYAKNQWAETPLQMFHSLLMRSLRKSNLFYAVVAPSYIGKVDYLLNTEIIELQHDIMRKNIRFSVAIQLYKMKTQKVIANRLFTVQVPARENTPYAGVVAANKAEAIILRKMIKFFFNTLH